jgi:hypothetical protein
MIPQIYQWEQANRAGQEANIGRQTAYDQQLIQNAQNYYQLARSNETQDYARQQAAQQLALKEQGDAEEKQRRNWEAMTAAKLAADRLAEEKSYHQRYFDVATKQGEIADAEKAKQTQIAGESKLMEFVTKNPDAAFEMSPQSLGTMFALKPDRVQSLTEELHSQYPDRMLSGANAATARAMAKIDPSKLKQNADYFLTNIEREIKARIPEQFRSKVAFNRGTGQFEWNANLNMNPPQTVDTEAMLQHWGENPPAPPENPFATATLTGTSFASPAAAAQGIEPSPYFGGTTTSTPQPAAPPSVTAAPPPVSIATQPAPSSQRKVTTLEDVKAAKKELDRVTEETALPNIDEQTKEARVADYFGAAPIRAFRQARAIEKYQQTLKNYETSNQVAVISPLGVRGKIPANQLKSALAKGYKLPP